jgi:membrane protein implicated in regulation of membrane protease activity
MVQPIDPHWGWLLLAVCLATAEILLPGVFLIWLAAAAFVTGLIAFLVTIPVPAQLCIFAAGSILAVYAGRRWFKTHKTESEDPLLNDRGARLVGRRGVVVEAIVNGTGRVRLGDSSWLATGPTMGVGDAARILAVDGTSLVVGPAGRRSNRPSAKEAGPRRRSSSRRRRSSRSQSGSDIEPTV